jgi:hypothetical protein
MDNTVEVSQAARDVALAYFRKHDVSWVEHMEKGGTHPLVLAFARFEATTRATQPEAALREALEEAKAALDGIYHYTFDNGLSGGDLRRLVRTEASDAAAVIDAALKDHRHG